MLYDVRITPQQLKAAAAWSSDADDAADVELVVDDRMVLVEQGDDRTGFDTGGEPASEEYLALAPLDAKRPTVANLRDALLDLHRDLFPERYLTNREMEAQSLSDQWTAGTIEWVAGRIEVLVRGDERAQLDPNHAPAHDWGRNGVLWTGEPGDEIQRLDAPDEPPHEPLLEGDMQAALYVAQHGFPFIGYAMDLEPRRWWVTAFKTEDDGRAWLADVRSEAGVTDAFVFDGRHGEPASALDGNGYLAPSTAIQEAT